MSFIGFFVDKKQENLVEQELKKITINNVKFETLIINNNIKKIQEKEEFKKIIANAKYILINSDEVNLSILNKLNATSITYGFNGKATVTMSSIEDDELILCLQRNIKTLQNKIIEPQEICINMQHNNLIDKYLVICIQLINLLYK